MRSLHATTPQARDEVARTAVALVVAGSWVAAAGLLLLGWALRAA